jgi:signal transduction histidine kinase
VPGRDENKLAPLADEARAAAWLGERIRRAIPAASPAAVRAAAEQLSGEVAPAVRECVAEISRLRALLDAVPDHIGMLAPDGTSLYFNRSTVEAIRESSGGRIDDPIGKRQHELGFPDGFVRQIRAEREVAASGTITSEILFPTPEGGRWREHTFAPIRDEGGALVGIAISSRDIHGRKLAEEGLAKELAFREQMMGVLGHDLRNPISAINLSVNLLVKQEDLPQRAQLMVARVGRAAARMNQMISALLDFTRLRFRERLPLSTEAMDLRETCEQIVDELRSASPAQEIHLTATGDTRGEWDPTRIGQVLSNLVGNAVAHGDPSAPVEVALRATQDAMVLEVRNRGPVIPEETMAVLFQPFRRGASPDGAESASRGLGLGLYIVKETVLAHGGSIAVESTLERGTTFTVRLPRARVPPRLDRRP